MAREVKTYSLSNANEEGGAGPNFTNDNGATFTAGKVGSALTLNSASSQRLRSSDTFFHVPTDTSFHLVFNFKVNNLTQNHGLAGQVVSTYHCHVLNVNDGLRFRIRAGGKNYFIDSSALVADTWYQASVGYDHASRQIFQSIDRAANTTNDLDVGDSVDVGTQDFTLGSIANDSYCDGQIDEFMMAVDGLFTTAELDGHNTGGVAGAFPPEETGGTPETGEAGFAAQHSGEAGLASGHTGEAGFTSGHTATAEII